MSSEQGLINSIFGLSYKSNGNANNNDLILNGFDGGFISSCRVGREGYHGVVVGGFVAFAQSGCVEIIIEVSGGVGISERTIFLVELHYLGQRDHLRFVQVDPELEAEYARRCQFARNIFEKPLGFDDLLNLKVSPNGHRLIAEYRNKIEPELADGGRYSHISLRGFASKINMQILKLATNIHLLDRDDDYQPNIPDTLIEAAIAMANDLLEANLELCIAKDLIGQRARFSAILKVFEKDRTPRTERQLIMSRKCVEPFKSYTGNKSDMVRQTIAEMVNDGIIGSTTLNLFL